MEWEATFATLNFYVVTARELLKSGVYDKYYSNVSELIESFEPMDEFFYQVLQSEHIKFIGDELAKFEASNFYFEKYGIIGAIQVYVDSNDIDYSNATLVALIERTAAEFENLKISDADYDVLLLENTRRFVEKCALLTGSRDYLDMKQALKDASVYFFNMDVSAATAQDALAVYIMREADLRAIEAYADEFREQVLALAICEGNPLENILICESYLDKLVTDVDGAAQALAQYEQIKAEYNAGIGAVINELASTRDYAVAANNTNGKETITTLVRIALER